MSRLLCGAALCAAIAVTATACTGAEDPGGTGDGSVSEKDDGGFGELYYAVHERDGETSTSRLLRWDGTKDGEVETVMEAKGARLFHTVTITGDGLWAVYAEGNEDGVLKMMDLKPNPTTNEIAKFPKTGGSCLTPAFVPGTKHQLLVPGVDKVTVHRPENAEVGESFGVGDCMPQPAVAAGDKDPTIFYLDHDGEVGSGEIMFVKPDGEVVDTGLGAKAAGFLDADRLHEISAVSPTGSQVCVEKAERRNGQDPHSRHGRCQVLIDVASGKFVKEFDGEDFAVRYTEKGLMLRKDGELSYYPAADDLAEPAQTLTEPEELAKAQLITVTDA